MSEVGETINDAGGNGPTARNGKRRRLVAGGVEVLAIRSVYPSLEDIFVSFTRQMDRKGFL